MLVQLIYIVFAMCELSTIEVENGVQFHKICKKIRALWTDIEAVTIKT